MNTVVIGIGNFTNTDVTGALVNAARLGAKYIGAKVITHRIQPTEIVKGRFVNAEIVKKLAHCDAIIIASPTDMVGFCSV